MRICCDNQRSNQIWNENNVVVSIPKANLSINHLENSHNKNKNYYNKKYYNNNSNRNRKKYNKSSSFYGYNYSNSSNYLKMKSNKTKTEIKTEISVENKKDNLNLCNNKSDIPILTKEIEKVTINQVNEACEEFQEESVGQIEIGEDILEIVDDRLVYSPISTTSTALFGETNNTIPNKSEIDHVAKERILTWIDESSYEKSGFSPDTMLNVNNSKKRKSTSDDDSSKERSDNEKSTPVKKSKIQSEFNENTPETSRSTRNIDLKQNRRTRESTRNKSTISTKLKKKIDLKSNKKFKGAVQFYSEISKFSESKIREHQINKKCEQQVEKLQKDEIPKDSKENKKFEISKSDGNGSTTTHEDENKNSNHKNSSRHNHKKSSNDRKHRHSKSSRHSTDDQTKDSSKKIDESEITSNENVVKSEESNVQNSEVPNAQLTNINNNDDIIDEQDVTVLECSAEKSNDTEILEVGNNVEILTDNVIDSKIIDDNNLQGNKSIEIIDITETKTENDIIDVDNYSPRPKDTSTKKIISTTEIIEVEDEESMELNEIKKDIKSTEFDDLENLTSKSPINDINPDKVNTEEYFQDTNELFTLLNTSDNSDECIKIENIKSPKNDLENVIISEQKLTTPIEPIVTDINKIKRISIDSGITCNLSEEKIDTDEEQKSKSINSNNNIMNNKFDVSEIIEIDDEEIIEEEIIDKKPVIDKNDEISTPTVIVSPIQTSVIKENKEIIESKLSLLSENIKELQNFIKENRCVEDKREKFPSPINNGNITPDTPTTDNINLPLKSPLNNVNIPKISPDVTRNTDTNSPQSSDTDSLINRGIIRVRDPNTMVIPNAEKSANEIEIDEFLENNKIQILKLIEGLVLMCKYQNIAESVYQFNEFLNADSAYFNKQLANKHFSQTHSSIIRFCIGHFISLANSYKNFSINLKSILIDKLFDMCKIFCNKSNINIIDKSNKWIEQILNYSLTAQPQLSPVVTNNNNNNNNNNSNNHNNDNLVSPSQELHRPELPLNNRISPNIPNNHVVQYNHNNNTNLQSPLRMQSPGIIYPHTNQSPVTQQLVQNRIPTSNSYSSNTHSIPMQTGINHRSNDVRRENVGIQSPTANKNSSINNTNLNRPLTNEMFEERIRLLSSYNQIQNRVPYSPQQTVPGQIIERNNIDLQKSFQQNSPNEQLIHNYKSPHSTTPTNRSNIYNPNPPISEHGMIYSANENAVDRNQAHYKEAATKNPIERNQQYYPIAPQPSQSSAVEHQYPMGIHPPSERIHANNMQLPSVSINYNKTGSNYPPNYQSYGGSYHPTQLSTSNPASSNNYSQHQYQNYRPQIRNNTPQNSAILKQLINRSDVPMNTSIQHVPNQQHLSALQNQYYPYPSSGHPVSYSNPHMVAAPLPPQLVNQQPPPPYSRPIAPNNKKSKPNNKSLEKLQLPNQLQSSTQSLKQVRLNLLSRNNSQNSPQEPLERNLQTLYENQQRIAEFNSAQNLKVIPPSLDGRRIINNCNNNLNNQQEISSLPPPQAQPTEKPVANFEVVFQSGTSQGIQIIETSKNSNIHPSRSPQIQKGTSVIENCNLPRISNNYVSNPNEMEHNSMKKLTAEESKNFNCTMCGGRGLFFCTKCNCACYCSDACQARDQEHQLNCQN